ncbi:MAG: CotH kinase family protein [Bacilli bacterium]|nr:CotH kinase family protein [Bacilli bacterium]
MSKRKIKTNFIIVLLFILLILFVLLINTRRFNITSTTDSKLYINEIMAINKNTIKDSYNEYSDYIEIYNGYDYEINLKGYFLSDEVTSDKKWMFPNIIIKPKEYLVIYASEKDMCDLTIRECHTNFKLGSKGETLSLLNNKGKVISKVKYPELTEDISYSLIDNNYKLTIGTPYKTNEDIELNFDDTIDVIINEVTIKSPEAIELKNLTDKDIDLSNYYIQDKSGIKYEFKNIKIKANSYLVLYGSDTPSITNNKIYLGFKINNSNEILYLYKNNKLIDKFDVGKLNENISKGRNEELEEVIYKKVTIGSNNSKVYYKGFSQIPVFSNNDVYVEKGIKVSLTVGDNSTIYYTLDGSIPNKNSKKYDGDITINKNTVIKAISYKDGYIESDIESRTYLVGRQHDLPVISISTNNSYLFGNDGIFTTGYNASSYYPYQGANFWKDVEVPITFEFYEEGQLALNFNGGMKIFGGWSRGEAQKSVAIYLRKKYGIQEITYPFFEDNINTFSKFILRSGGQDFGKLKIKDAFLQETLDGQMDIDKQDYRPVVVYINGEYYGLYNIREKTDTSYVERHYGLDESEFDFIEKNSDVKSGTIDEYNKLLNYVKNNDITTDEAYEYLDSQVDLQELANYWVVETYYGQFDPMNIKFFKPENGKWRWILFDLDQTLFSYSYRTINWKLPFEPYAHGNSYYFNTTLMNRLIKNPKFRSLYIKTFAYHLNNTFKPDRMNQILDRMVNEIKSEMPYHIDRWYNESIRVSSYTLDNMDEWYSNINYLKKQLKERHQIALNTIKEGLGLTNEEYQKYFKN